MTPINKVKPATLKFLKKVRIVLENHEVQAFRWSEDGKSVVINFKMYEKEIKKHKRLSFLKKLRNIDDIHRVLSIHGFKKIARKSTADVHIFRHPYFSGQGNAEKNHAVAPVRQLEPKRKALKMEKDGSTEEHPGACGPLLDLPSLHTAFSTKKTHARGLYQYINHGFPDIHNLDLSVLTASVSRAEGVLDTTATSGPSRESPPGVPMMDMGEGSCDTLGHPMVSLQDSTFNLRTYFHSSTLSPPK